MSDSFEITYAAHTGTCTFLLDSDGICRRIVVASNSSKRRDAARAAARCVGAQYVASLDASVSGMLTEMPRVGGAMLFARVDERGRVSLVRTGVVTRFESNRDEDPFQETDKAPSMSVETSAPELTPSAPTPRRARPASASTGIPADPYSEEAHDRTQPIQALSPNELRLLREEGLDKTSEYRSEPAAAQRRVTWPSPGNEMSPGPGIPTLRQPIAVMPPISEEEHDPYAERARHGVSHERGVSSPEGVVPRPPRSEPYAPRTTRTERISRGATDSVRTYAEKVAASRRRGDR